MGTTPHILILSYAAAGSVDPTADAARAFDRYVDRSVPRVILIDTFNREIDDALEAARALGDRMAGARIDTCWENVAQGADAQKLPPIQADPRYLRGGGVTIPAVWALRRALDEGGFPETTLFVSSGFDAAKTAAFVEARKVYGELYGKALFDGIGTGSLLPGGRMATADMVQVRRDGRWIDCAKTGRRYRPNPALRKVW
jgi:nicotinate phosphoribosyltransferase